MLGDTTSGTDRIFIYMDNVLNPRMLLYNGRRFMKGRSSDWGKWCCICNWTRNLEGQYPSQMVIVQLNAFREAVEAQWLEYTIYAN